MRIIAPIFKFLSWVTGVSLFLFAWFVMSHVADSTLTVEVLIGVCFVTSFYLSTRISLLIGKVFRANSQREQDDSLFPLRVFVIIVLFIPCLLLNGSFNVGEYKTVMSMVSDKDRNRTKNGYTYEITLSYKNESVNIYVDSDVWNYYDVGDCVILGVQRGLLGFYVVKNHGLKLDIYKGFRQC